VAAQDRPHLPDDARRIVVVDDEDRAFERGFDFDASTSVRRGDRLEDSAFEPALALARV
jgi:hypothetical protein